ncbi:MAG: hypothetical protein V3U42_02285 [candidate division NC10 bacterium]|jgi:rubredoxin|nr:hypothetical protein [candidate division NC10 bacterium]MCZ6551470.1 hypothetical protein [candidate division NC10 bacterium]
MKVICPNCGGEDEISSELDHDLEEGCVRLERLTCPHCQVARALFMQYPHEEG